MCASVLASHGCVIFEFNVNHSLRITILSGDGISSYITKYIPLYVY
jgi:hypothetical protein